MVTRIVTAMEARLATLETDVASLQTDNANLVADNALLENFIAEVIPYLQGGADAQGNPAVFFSGVNVHVNNGEGATASVDGTGNLIVGYDESLGANSDFCTVVAAGGSAHLDQTSCENNVGIWGRDAQKIGSHNLIIGSSHNYTQYAGLIAGFNNTITAIESSISGGANNFAQGLTSSVSGGSENDARGGVSSISGGQSNTASSVWSSVSGGNYREASDFHDWVAGSLTEDE